MAVLPIMLTTAGLDALVDAQAAITTAIEITQVGLSSAPFTPAPTLIALPHEFKRLGTLDGIAAAENIIHMTALDDSDDSYTAFGFGLFLADGTLFGTYAQATPLALKAAIPKLILSVDIGFLSAVDAAITFGATNFVFPPATTITPGVAEIATQAEVDTGTDATRIVTPLTLATRIAGLLAPVTASIAALSASVAASIATLTGRTITGGGLATGGGDLSANRTITVTEASEAQSADTANATTVITPRRWHFLNGPLAATVAAAVADIATLFARTITSSGLATGGGNLSTNRVIGVPPATRAEVTALASTSKAVTPDALNGLYDLPTATASGLAARFGPFLLKRVDVAIAPDSSTAVTFPTPFPNGIFGAWLAGGQTGGFSIDSNDAVTPPSSWTVNGATIHHAGNSATTVALFALGW